MHRKLSPSLGTYCRVEKAWINMTEQGERLKIPSGECYGSFEEAEITLAARRGTGFVGKVAVCSFMHYLSNILEGWQFAKKLDKRIQK